VTNLADDAPLLDPSSATTGLRDGRL